MDSTPLDPVPDIPQINGTLDQIPDSNSNIDPPAPAPAPAPAPEPRSSPSPSRKGYGLKKWRRIPRNSLVTTAKEMEPEVTDKDRDSDSESIGGRMLKRGSSNIVNGNDSTPPSIKNSNDSAGADYSEDRGSSKSSKFGVRGSRDKNHPRGKNVSSKSPTDSTKKPKDDKDRERESSPISSFESDSRSVFIPPSALNLDPDACVSPPLEQQSDQQQQQQQEHVAEFSSSSVNQGNCKVDYVGDCDPLVDSILLLQSAQLALQAEVQKFGEIGKGIYSLYDDSDKTSGIALDAVVHMANGSMCDGCIDNGNLSNSVQTLERQLNEAESRLKDKDLRIAELEATLRSMESPQDHVKGAMEQQYKRCTEMEAELQVLFRQKLEAEVLSVVMTRSSKDLSVLVKEHNLLAKEELQSHRMMVDLENKDGQPVKLDTSYTGDEIREIHRGVNKLTRCFVIQLFLLFVVITLFVFQLAPKSAVVVPT